MTSSGKVPAETGGGSTSSAMVDAESAVSRRRLRGMNEAWRWMIAGVILVVAVGAQLIVDLQSSSGVNAADFAGGHWLPLVLIASGSALVVGGIVKSRRS